MSETSTHQTPSFVEGLERLGTTDPQTMLKEAMSLFGIIQTLSADDLISAYQSIDLFHAGAKDSPIACRQLKVIKYAIITAMKHAWTQKRDYGSRFEQCVGYLNWIALSSEKISD